MTWPRALLVATVSGVVGFAVWWRLGAGEPPPIVPGPPDTPDRARLRGIVAYYQHLAEQRRLTSSEAKKMEEAAQALWQLGGDHVG